ncbi:ABC transporter permease [Aminobacter ciceronei]|uniref:Peptide/nickel transport system permease protein n=1 Tax=Aminobacter ciceronei TaxID=150723 RepID=A0ABR6CFD4_9HYPH|nr:ABC transporter permease [Aminobacter ciceronei]MBA8909945.1 peptide/nickel transport system permease protein [Aminobacter ciceronei]MBA9023717.1 peptide/nickel transport system permease protein [Aminobacter ciceronei]
MLEFICRRILSLFPVILGLLVLTYALLYLAPSDPATILAGENASVEDIQAVRKEYGLDRPVYVQFGMYLKQVSVGNLGVSMYSNRPVLEDIAQRLPATIELALVSLVLMAIGGITLGTMGAVWHNSPIDHVTRMISVAGLAIATFWLAIMLQLVFAMVLGWFPVRGRIPPEMVPPVQITGLYLLDSILTLNFSAFRDAVRHITLPAITLAFGGLATVARFTRSSMLENLTKEYVSYQHATGVPFRRIIVPYVLRNSVITAVTQLGLLFGSLISGAVVVEMIFDWPGIGSYLVNAIFTSDYKVILAVTIVVGVIYALVNIIVDVIHAMIDPRLR